MYWRSCDVGRLDEPRESRRILPVLSTPLLKISEARLAVLSPARGLGLVFRNELPRGVLRAARGDVRHDVVGEIP
jgi:hypothetical protein